MGAVSFLNGRYILGGIKRRQSGIFAGGIIFLATKWNLPFLISECLIR